MTFIDYIATLIVLAIAVLAAGVWYLHRRKDPTPIQRASDNIETMEDTDSPEVKAAVHLDSVSVKADSGDLPFMKVLKNPDNVYATNGDDANRPAPSAISADESGQQRVAATELRIDPSLDDGGAGIDSTSAPPPNPQPTGGDSNVV